MITLVYKQIDGHALKADFYEAARKGAPVVLFIHGGGLIFGCRTMALRHPIDLYLSAGYAVLAIDYRLAPETKAAQIVIDVRDAIRFVQKIWLVLTWC